MAEELPCFLWCHCLSPFLPSPQTSQVRSSRPSDKTKRRHLSEGRESGLLVPFPLKSLLTGAPFVQGSGDLMDTASALTGLSAQERGQLNKCLEGLVGG